MYNLDKALKIAGWMSYPELSFLAEIASKSKVIIEAGSFQGRSTRAMADNSAGNTTIYAVDPWRPMPLSMGRLMPGCAVGVDDTTFTRFTLNMMGHEGKVIPILKKFVDFTTYYEPDFIFIDALHDYNNVKADIAHALTLIKKGILAGHDYVEQFDGVRTAVHEQFGDNVKITDTIWSVEI